MLAIDLNADLGEECGDDEALLRIVTTANVAAGGHAGGGDVLDATVRNARAAGVVVGAHPSYPDRPGFGRVSMAQGMTSSGIADCVAEQVHAVMTACARAGSAMAHVKAHGALYHDAAHERWVADAFLDGIREAAGTPAIVGMPGTRLEQACADRGLPFVVEAFADRAYAADGSLVPRDRPGAVLHDADAVAERVLRLVQDGELPTIDGGVLALSPQTLCVHGDTAGAVEMAQVIRERLSGAGVRLAAVSG